MAVKITYHLGNLLGRRFRVWYWRRTGGRWWWGISRAIHEVPYTTDPPRSEYYDEIERFMEEVFKWH